MVSIFGLVFVLIILGAAAYLAEQLARNRGRARSPWILATLAAGLVGYLAGALLLGWAMKADDRLLLLTLVSGPVISVGLQAAVLIVLYRLPKAIPRTRRSRWSVYVKADPTSQGKDCHLVLEPDHMLITPIEDQSDRRDIIPYTDIIEGNLDGESLHLCWRAPDEGQRQVMLLPNCAPSDPPADVVCKSLLARIYDARSRIKSDT